ncbi:hypothetical protein PR048_018381 [Dryococelus australis]|uniref:DUF4371 domain-containing protein n=1 Tax=Dryococelus australis TaxID=614101 RepID=A0ABQ9HC32_9NEOP|nr:hypothetical protein PR048_018381 [Dryococelus australis]
MIAAISSLRDNWLSLVVQNEILQIMSHMVLKNIVGEISKSPFIGIIADSITDISGEEQFYLCVICVSPDSIQIKEFLVGMYM